MIPFGGGRTEAERAFEATLHRVAPWQGRPMRYRPVLGGISNTNWRVEVAGEAHPYFVKMPGRGTEMFIDRAAARAASRQAEAIGLGPRTFDYLDAEDVEIAEFVEGRRPSTNRDFADAAVRSEAIALYRRFHDAPLLPLTKTVFDMIDEHDRQAVDLGALLPPDQAWLTRQTRLARAARRSSSVSVSTHAACSPSILSSSRIFRNLSRFISSWICSGARCRVFSARSASRRQA